MSTQENVMLSKKKLPKLLVGCALPFFLFGCEESAKNDLNVKEKVVLKASAEEAITATLNDLVDKGINVEGEGRRFLPNGEVQYARLTLSEEGKKPVRMAIWKTGHLMPHGEASRLYNSEYRKAYGSLSESLASALGETTDTHTQELSFAAWFDGSSSQLDLYKKKIKEMDPAALIRTKEPYVAFFKGSLKSLVESEMHKSDVFSAIYPLGTPKPTSCSSNPQADVNPATQGSANWSGSANSFNANGFYGQGVKVGVMEPHPAERGIWDGHSSMSNLEDGTRVGAPLRVEYQNPPRECDRDIECGLDICRPFPDGQGRCVSRHISQVSSRISSAYEFEDRVRDRHASRVSMYIPDFPAPSSSTSELYDRVVKSYNWLIGDNDVKIINESWTSIGAIGGQESVFPTFHDSLQSWYTFHEGVTFIKAAGNPGNFGINSQGAAPSEEVNCHALNTICVGSVDSKCSYENYLDDTMDQPAGSAWRNPYMTYRNSCINQIISPNCTQPAGAMDTQIERPDIVAEGFLPLVMNLYPDSTNWSNESYEQDVAANGNNNQFIRFNYLDYPDSPNPVGPVQGTSFAAPVITGMVAMCENASRETTSNSIDPLMHKTLVRFSAEEQRNLESASQNSLFYPSYFNGLGRPNPFYTRDYNAGAGIQMSSVYMDYCRKRFDGQPGTNGGRGSGIFVPGTGQPFPEELVTSTDGSGFGGSTRNDINRWISNRQPILRQQPGYESIVLAEIGAVREGERVRSVLTFDACPRQNKAKKGEIQRDTIPADPNNSLGFFPSADVELALCGIYEGSPACEAFSDSAMDSTEGFDKVFTRSMERVEIRMLIPNGAEGCFPGQPGDKGGIGWSYAHKYWYFT